MSKSDIDILSLDIRHLGVPLHLDLVEVKFNYI